MADTQLLVIGGGPGGYHAAIRAAQKGMDVTCVDKGSFGGVCLHWGCIPSKGLIGLGKLVDELDGWSKRGVTVDNLDVDLPAFQAWKGKQIDQLSRGVQHLMKSRGVDVKEGTVELTGEHEATIDGEPITFEKALIAVGSRPVELPHIPFDHEIVLSSKSALALEEIPETMAVIGGGFIGLEIGQFYHQLGTEVTVVEMLDSILPTADADVSKEVTKHLKRAGIDIRTGTKAAGAKVGEQGAELELETQDGEREVLSVDKVLVAVGRRPNGTQLDLEAAGVDINGQGFIEVDDQMRTSNPDIFAIGDCVPGPALAHKASFEGLHAAAVAAGNGDVVVDHRAIPWFVYTTPEVGSVGLTEEEAREQHGDDLIVGQFPFMALGKAKMAGHTEGWCKVIARPDEAILGVHIVGPDATNLISEPALAIEMGATLTDIAETVHAHPTLAEVFMEAVEVA
ncbi:MAG: dihydrolipoyl dehydrogenase, partial [Candidatus Thermoplasmatota archaeon]|nr:dihydrolipoyl dehydrogenase [Candidatus Thermoplasmatota archaeon]